MSDASVWCKSLNNNDLSYTEKSWFIHIPCILKKISRVMTDTSLFCEPKLVFLLATQPMHEPWCNFSDTSRDVLYCRWHPMEQDLVWNCKLDCIERGSTLNHHQVSTRVFSHSLWDLFFKYWGWKNLWWSQLL